MLAEETQICFPLSETEVHRLQKEAVDTLQNYTGGAVAVAPYLNKSSHSLCNEVNPRFNKAKLGLVDAVGIMLVTQDNRILKSMAQLMGFALIHIGRFDGVSDMELLDAYAEWHLEVGDVAHEVRTALADGKVTRDEFERIHKEGQEQITAFYEFMRRLEGLIDEN